MDDNMYDEFGNYIGPEYPEVDNVSVDADDEQDDNIIKEDQNTNVVNITVRFNFYLVEREVPNSVTRR